MVALQTLSTRLRHSAPRPSLTAPPLRIVPLVAPPMPGPAYRVYGPGLASKVVVREVSASGTVNRLVVQNTLDVAVFIIDGQTLLGAKQNRIVNADLLVPAGTTIEVDASCVEQGRWRAVSAAFRPASVAPRAVRMAKAAHVARYLKLDMGHRSDQGEVWNAVSETLQDLRAHSPTSSLDAAHAARARDLRRFREHLVMPADAIGFAAFVGDAFAGVELFDRAETLAAYWDSLTESYALDALARATIEAPAALDDHRAHRPDPSLPEAYHEALRLAEALRRRATGDRGDEAREDAADRRPPAVPREPAVHDTLLRLADASWSEHPAPAGTLGTDLRLDEPAHVGSALVCDDAVIHLQVFARTDDRRRGRRDRRGRA